MQDFRGLRVWQQSHQLVIRVYQVTRGFPSDELYGLTSQLRRASISVPSNIAEGCGRSSDADFARCLHVAMGSACEVQYQLQLAHDLGYMNEEQFEDLDRRIVDMKQMLAALISRLRPASSARSHVIEADDK